MDFIFCEERDQRVSKAVCQANVKKGKCTQDLLKCGKKKTPKGVKFPLPNLPELPPQITDTTPTLDVDHIDHLHILKTPSDPEKGQLDLFSEIHDDNFGEYGPLDEMGEGEDS